jgi:polyhydroxyalkanoate synthesis repressor PhaR
MPLIKRYPNRKLYDTEAKHYVSLAGVAELIRQGAELHVIDYASGDDITNLVLTQVIAEQERRRGGAVPQSLLAGLIQAGEQTLAAFRRGMVESLEWVRQVDEEIERRVQSLVERGILEQEEAHLLSAELGAAAAHTPAALDLREQGIPTRADLRRLSEQLDALSAQLDSLAAQDRAEGGAQIGS